MGRACQKLHGSLLLTGSCARALPSTEQEAPLHAIAAHMTAHASVQRAHIAALVATVLAPLLVAGTILDSHQAVAVILLLTITAAIGVAIASASGMVGDASSITPSTTAPPGLSCSYVITDAPRAPRRPRAPGLC